jgi:CDP-4-dehydro-6-deoxyglucose reductase
MTVDSSIEARVTSSEIENHDATIVDSTPMDHNRETEIESVIDTHRDVIRERLDIEAKLGPLGSSGKIDALKKRLERPYPSLVRLRAEVEGAQKDCDDTSFEYAPGQYARISYGDEEPRVYSIASSPNREYLELCIRRVPGGHLTPVLCERASPGDDLFVRGPYGDELLLREPSERDLVFVATGTGVAPFKGMIDYVFEEGMDEHDGEKRDVWLFLGSSWEDHLPYRDEFRALEDDHDNFHFVPTVSRERYLTDWDGETDYVQYCLLKYLDGEKTDLDTLPGDFADYVDSEAAYDTDARIDPARIEAYVCGIGAMCSRVRNVVTALDIDEEYLNVESYG